MPSWYELGQERDCSWWGWYVRYPIDNLRRIWRNHTT